MCTTINSVAITLFRSYSAEVHDRNSPKSLSWHCGHPVCSREYHYCNHQLPLRRRRPRCIPLCVSQGGHCQSEWRWSDNPTVSYVSPPSEFCCPSFSIAEQCRKTVVTFGMHPFCRQTRFVPGRRYSGETLIAHITDGSTITDYGTFTIWCRLASVFFTRINIPSNLFSQVSTLQ